MFIFLPGCVHLLRLSGQISEHMILIVHENVELLSCVWILCPDILYLLSVVVLNMHSYSEIQVCRPVVKGISLKGRAYSLKRAIFNATFDCIVCFISTVLAKVRTQILAFIDTACYSLFKCSCKNIYTTFCFCFFCH